MTINYDDQAARDRIRDLCLRRARQIQNSNSNFASENLGVAPRDDSPSLNEYDVLPFGDDEEEVEDDET